MLQSTSVQLIHVDNYNFVQSLHKFLLKTDKAEYQIETQINLKEGGKGALILLSLDHSFSEQENSDIGRSTIFKASIEKYSDFEDLKI